MIDLNSLHISPWYGKARFNFLKDEKPELYNEMLNNGTLEEHLISINEQAWEMEERMVEQFMVAEGVTEELKRQDSLEWAGRLNNIKHRVREIIQHELIFV